MRDAMLLHHAQGGRLVAQIHRLKNVFRMAGDRLQILPMAGVGEAVEIDELGDLRIVNDALNQIGADEARAAGDE